MSVRSRMIHRASIERDANAGLKDAYNNALAADFASHIDEQPCYYFMTEAWQRGEMQGERNVKVYSHQLLIPLGLDITEADQVNGIADRQDGTVSGETFNIAKILRRKDHMLLTLESVI